MYPKVWGVGFRLINFLHVPNPFETCDPRLVTMTEWFR